jgi:outer membrane protein assembly factor BamB
VAIRRTTICCSAIALVVSWCVDVAAQTATSTSRQVKQTRSADDKTPMQLFPLEPLWTLPLNSALTAAPAFDRTRGFFPLEGAVLAAYDLVGRRKLWTAEVQTAVEPVAGNGLVFVVAPESIVALRAEDGVVAWIAPFTEPLAVPPAINGDWLVTATTAADVEARRVRDGSVAWRQHLNAPAHARPEISGTRIYVPTADAHVIALNRDTGAVLWDVKLGKPGNEILGTDERLYLGSEDRNFYCLNATTGAEEWRWATGANVIGRPVADEQTVYFVALDNVLRGLNRSSGVQRWKSPLPLRPSTGPVKWSQTLVVVGTTPGLKAFNAKDGKSAGQASTSGELSAPPQLVDNPSWPFPTLVAVTSDIIGRATVTASTRTVEAELVPVAPLPNAVIPTAIPAPNPSPVSPAAGP